MKTEAYRPLPGHMVERKVLPGILGIVIYASDERATRADVLWRVGHPRIQWVLWEHLRRIDRDPSEEEKAGMTAAILQRWSQEDRR